MSLFHLSEDLAPEDVRLIAALVGPALAVVATAQPVEAPRPKPARLKIVPPAPPVDDLARAEARRILRRKGIYIT